MKNYRKEHGKNRILTYIPQKSEIENQRAKNGKYSGKMLEKKTVKKNLIAADSSER
jgi:hypothetical protein